MNQNFTESMLRDFLAERVGDLRNLITNADEWEQRQEALKQDFFNISPDQGGPTSLDLMRLIVSRRNLRGLTHLHDLNLITHPERANVEFPLLEGGASADILAVAPETGTFYLLELKRLRTPERQAVSELSTYSLGLHNRFWGMTSSDVVWVPISTVWSNPVRAAFAYQMLCRDVAILPLKATVELSDDSSQIVNVELELLDLLPEIDEPLAASQFAWDCFDTLVFSLKKPPANPTTVIDFITSTAARYQFSGFVTYATSLLEDNIMYPYNFLIATHNPLKALLKRRQLEIVLGDNETDNLMEMRREVKRNRWLSHDIDFRTGKDMEINPVAFFQNAMPSHTEQEDETVSVREIASASCNRTSDLFKDLVQHFNLLDGGFEVGTPNLRSLVLSGPIYFPPVQQVGYFGLLQETLYSRLLWEFHNQTEYGDGPILGDLCGDPTGRAMDPITLFEFMELMNWEHDSQTDYYNDEDEEGNTGTIDDPDQVVDDVLENASDAEDIGEDYE